MMKTRMKQVMAALATTLSVTIASAATQTVPGITPADSDVTPSGAFTYQVPLSLPAGVNGLVPGLALSYNSSSLSESQLGVGWSLSGSSQITRCDHSRLQDGYIQQALYDTTQNRYCLDGQRLVPRDNKHTDYSIPNRTYRLQNDDFSKIQSIGRVGYGPKEFKVWKKSGQIFTYGAVSGDYDSRIEAQGFSDGTVAVWALGSIEDRHGNVIRFKYGHDKTTGHFRPEAVDYAFASGTPQARVTFAYEGNTTRDFDRLRFHSGVRMDSEDRLTKIVTYARPQTGQAFKGVKEYQLSYRESQASKRSLLTQVQECAYSEAGAVRSCFEPLSFTWGDDSRLFQRVDLDANGPADSSDYRLPGVSADLWDKSLAMPLDYNADGLSDLILHAENKVYLLTGKRRGDGVPVGVGGLTDITSRFGGSTLPDTAKVTVMDFNADGNSDLIVSKVSSNQLEIWVYPGHTGSSLGFGAGTRIYTRNVGSVLANYKLSQLSLDGDPYVDLIVQYSHTVRVNKGEGEWETTVKNYADFLRNTSNATTPQVAAAPAATIGTLNDGGYSTTTTWYAIPERWDLTQSKLIVLDFNGDGLSDVLAQNTINNESYLLLNTGGTGTNGQFMAYPLGGGMPYGISKKGLSSVDIIPTDFNGDGLTDLLLHHRPEGAQQHTRLMVSTGSRVAGKQFVYQSLQNLPGISNAYWDGQYRSTIMPFDVNGDGMDDLILQGNDATEESNIFLSTGMLKGLSGGKKQPYIWFDMGDLSSGQELQSTTVWNRTKFNLVTIDFNHDGQMDLLQKNVKDDQTHTHVLLSRPSSRDRITKVTDGLGRGSHVGYASLLDASVYSRTATSNDAAKRYLAGVPGEVVRTLTAANLGESNNAQTVYAYQDLRIHRERGSQGFATVTSTNKVQKNDGSLEVLSKLTRRFLLDFPLTGTLSSAETHVKNGTAWFLQSKTQTRTTAIEKGTSPVRFYWTRQIDNRTWTYSETGTQLTYDKTAYSQYDGYGNIRKIVNTAAHNLAGTVITTTLNQYDNLATPWILGRLTQSDVTHLASGSHYQGPEISRKASFTYNGKGSLLTEKSYYPNNQTKTTTYGYDSQGHVVSEKISGSGIAARTTNYTYGSLYGGRFKTKTTNALNHSETTDYNGRLGVPTKLTGPNGLATEWTYDDYARPVKEERADGTWTHTARYQAGLHNSAGAVITTLSDSPFDANASGDGANVDALVRTYAVTGAALAEVTTQSSFARNFTYSDASSRELGKVTFVTRNGSNEQALITKTQYDYQGRVWKRSQPAFADQSLKETVIAYDNLGRVKKETAPGNITTQYAYAGNGQVTVTDPESHKLWTRTGPEGRELWSKDHSGNIVKFYYDATGNLVLTQAGGLNYQVEHDAMGRKTTMSDPDMGNWSYKHNVLDQLIEQTDAKGQKVYLEYDLLGRKTKRWDVPAGQAKSTDPTVEWVYDSANGAGVGKLHYVSGGDLLYRQVTHYDNQGRVRVVNTKMDRNGNGSLDAAENTQEGYTYDAEGRVKTVHNHVTGLKTENTYHRSGQLTQIKRLQETVTTPSAADRYIELADTLAANIAPVTAEIAAKTTQLSTTQSTISTLTQEIASLTTAIGTIQLDKASADQDAADARDTMISIRALYGVEVPLSVLGLPLQVSTMTDQGQNADYQAARATYESAAAEAIALGETLSEMEGTYTQKQSALTAAQSSKTQLETDIAALNDSIAGKPEALAVLRLSAERISQGQSPVSDIYWQALEFDRWGNVVEFKLGNGVVTTRTYDSNKATLSTILAKAGSTKVQETNYNFDRVGNLKVRHDVLGQGIHETFNYDSLYRLKDSQITGKFTDSKSWTYKANGNIRNNASRLCSGVSGDCLKYNLAAHPHAVSQAGSVTYQYDANGNMTSGSDGRLISWTTFNKPKTLIQNANAHYETTRSLALSYGAEHQRIRQVSVLDTTADDINAVTETTWYYGNGYLQIEKAGDIVEHHQQIGVPGASILVVRHDKADGTIKGESTSYLHQDHLGSTAVITGRDSAGKVVVLERQYYDAFGLPLAGDSDARTAATTSSDITKQGFTGHETLAAFGLIQMNARLYDPVLGRFISADTFIQSPLNLQSYNRYSYVLNNPLSYTDPTGHFFAVLTTATVAYGVYRAAHWASDNPRQAFQIAFTVMVMYGTAGIVNPWVAAGVSGGFIGAGNTIIAGGSAEDVLVNGVKGAAIAMVSAAAFSQLHDMEKATTWDRIGRSYAHGMIGGSVEVLRGGDTTSFKRGFIAAAVTNTVADTSFMSSWEEGNSAMFVAASATVGGTVSAINGGSFANGAVTGGFQALFNHMNGLQRRKQSRAARASKGSTQMPDLAPGNYAVIVDSLSVGASVVAGEMGDLYIIDTVGERVIHLRYSAKGFSVGLPLGLTASREFGVIAIGGMNDVLGNGLVDSGSLVLGFGNTTSVSTSSNLQTRSISSGFSVGVSVGAAPLYSNTWFAKTYSFDNAPNHLPLSNY